MARMVSASLGPPYLVDGVHQMIDIHGLYEMPVEPRTIGLSPCFGRAVAAHCDQGHVSISMDPAKTISDLEATHDGKAEIEQDYLGFEVRGCFERFSTTVHDRDVMPEQ